MIAYSSIKPAPIWIREVENGVRHVTLRRNFTQSTITNTDGIAETQFQFEETDLFIQDRDNIESYINTNFDTLFTQGAQQAIGKQALNAKIQQTQQIIKDGSIVDTFQQIGQQITNILIGG